MQPIHQLADELNHERQALAEQQRPVRRYLKNLQAARRADRAQLRHRRRNARKALRPRIEPEQ
jgi:hypothetical protein